MASVREFDNYRDYLKAVLHDKMARNPSFSLRRLAAVCGVSAPCLSRIFNGRRRLSPGTANKIALALQLSAKDTEYLQNLVALETASNAEDQAKLVRRLSRDRLRRSPILPLETFRAVADWQHFAILSLVNSRGFRPDLVWIARRLGLSFSEAKNAWQRLHYLGLLKEVDGKVTVTDTDIQTPHDMSDSAVRENHRQQMKNAERGLMSLPVELREFANLSVCMNLQQLPEAKRRIREFLDSFNTEFDQAQSTEVFQFNVQFFPLTTIEKGKTK